MLHSLFLFQLILAGYTHGVKRSGSYSRDGDNHKVSKHKHQGGIVNQKDDTPTTNNLSSPTKLPNLHNQSVTTTIPCNDTIFQPGVRNTYFKSNGNATFKLFQLNDVNLWPPFSVTVTPMNNTQACTMSTTPTCPGGFAAGVFPMYYIPTTHQTTISGQYNDPIITSARYQGNIYLIL